MKIFYFTATGNSLYVAKSIGGELLSIAQMMREGQSEFADDEIGFVFPCYGLGLPKMVREFIRKSQFKAKYFFAVMTYGNVAAAGLGQLEEIGTAASIQFDYTNEICMIDNYLPMYRIEEQLKMEDTKQIDKHLESIVSDIGARRKKLTRKGFLAVVGSKLVYLLFSAWHFDVADKRFIVQENCNGCKICEKVCPKNNITVGTKPEFLHQCEGCFACIHHCPQYAIHHKSEKSNARFKNQHVTLAEIITANQ